MLKDVFQTNVQTVFYLICDSELIVLIEEMITLYVKALKFQTESDVFH